MGKPKKANINNKNIFEVLNDSYIMIVTYSVYSITKGKKNDKSRVHCTMYYEIMMSHSFSCCMVNGSYISIMT